MGVFTAFHESSAAREREERGKAPPAKPPDRKHGCRAAGYEEEEDRAPKSSKNRFSSATGTGRNAAHFQHLHLPSKQGSAPSRRDTLQLQDLGQKTCTKAPSPSRPSLPDILLQICTETRNKQHQEQIKSQPGSPQLSKWRKEGNLIFYLITRQPAICQDFRLNRFWPNKVLHGSPTPSRLSWHGNSENWKWNSSKHSAEKAHEQLHMLSALCRGTENLLFATQDPCALHGLFILITPGPRGFH